MNKKMAIVLIVFALAVVSCNGITVNLGGRGTQSVEIVESGNVVTEDRAVSGFDSISFDGIGELVITQGDTESLTVQADENVMPHIVTEVKGSELSIHMDRALNLNLRKPITYTLTVKDLRSLNHNGLGDIRINALTTDNLEISLQGAGNLEIHDLSAKTLKAGLKGLGRINATGEVDSLQLNLPGAGSFEGDDLRSQTADVEVTGLGSATVWAVTSLKATITGAGSINYYGSPQVSQEINGLGSVNSKGNK